MPPKNILITGCSPGGQGIGCALAKAFQLEGHRVFATGLDQDSLKPLSDLGIETFPLDVTDEASIAAAVSHLRQATSSSSSSSFDDDNEIGQTEKDPSGRRLPETGNLHILINNAGLLHLSPFADLSLPSTRRLFDVNVLGLIAVSQAFLPLLINAAAAATDDPSSSQKAPPDPSIIANLGSVNTIFRPPYLSTYNASKAAVEALSATMRPELAPLGVRVVTLKTGSVRTGLFDHDVASAREDVVGGIPEGSWYSGAGEYIRGRKNLEGARFMDADEYAKGVVGELLRRPEPRAVIWKGGLTWVAWLVGLFGWEGMMDSVYIKDSCLGDVKRPVKGQVYWGPGGGSTERRG